ncbi:MAG: hypothetical protein FWD73_12050, partial [Polyangiaceae bacterium]|nr:hypothetical protein [Polyangiaceae bacterium]
MIQASIRKELVGVLHHRRPANPLRQKLEIRAGLNPLLLLAGQRDAPRTNNHQKALDLTLGPAPG